jgi:hypothetical protein
VLCDLFDLFPRVLLGGLYFDVFDGVFDLVSDLGDGGDVAVL